MSTEQEVVNQQGGTYGYATDEVKQSPFNFGLNAGKTFLKTFEWINNGGANGAEQEALDIVFTINGTDKSYRLFPITKAFDKDNNEVTDPNAPAFKEAFVDLNARITHILHCFQEIDVIKAAMARPIKSFKEFCGIAMNILPKNYKEIPLDIFLQFQWQIRTNQTRTYLEIPTKMKYGKWLCPAQPGTWTEEKVENPDDNHRDALKYVNESGDVHTFTRNGWYVKSNFAKSQKNGSDEGSTSSATNSMETTAGADAPTVPVEW